MTRPIIPARANVMGLDVADKSQKGRLMRDREITHARSGARIIPKPRPYTAPTSPIADALALAGLVVGMMVLMGAGAAFADDRCAEARAMPGAAIYAGRAAASDLIVLAPQGDALRWCYWNSPASGGDRGTINVAGEEIAFRVQITGGPEIVHFDLPGAIATDLSGVPLREVSAPDGEEREGLLWRGMS